MRIHRLFIKSPGFAANVVLTLSLGIGLTTSMFSLMNRMVLSPIEPLNIHDADELIRVFRVSQEGRDLAVSGANFFDLKRGVSNAAHLTGYSFTESRIAGEGRDARAVQTLRVSPDFFDTIGVQPLMGRAFVDVENRVGQDSVVILGHSLWQSQFGGAAGIVGSEVRIDGQPMTVVGVAPTTFNDPLLFGPVDLFRPLAMTEEERTSRTNHFLQVFGRLKPGVSVGEARAAVSGAFANLKQDHPVEIGADGITTITLEKSATPPGTLEINSMLLGLSIAVLLIVCANLAGLQLARALGNVRESAVRAALGASRWDIVSPMIRECLALSLIGGGLGVLVALGANRVIDGMLMTFLPVPFHFEVEWKALGFAFCASVVAGLAFGLAPSLIATRVPAAGALRVGLRGVGGSRRQSRLSSSLVAGQFALAVVLLAVAAYYLAGVDHILRRGTGWQADGLLQGQIVLPPERYADAPEQIAFFRLLEQRLASWPGVDSVSISSNLPWRPFGSRNYVVEGRPVPPSGQEPVARVNRVTAAYFETTKTEILEGRPFSAADADAGAPLTAIINASMADSLFPGGDALGSRIGGVDPEDRQWMRIVGIASDVDLQHGSWSLTPFQVYRPLSHEPRTAVFVAVRTSGPPEAFSGSFRSTLADLDADLPIQDLMTMQKAIERDLRGVSVLGQICAAFASFGVLLAAIGVYGVTSRLVMRRTPEIGIRIAHGAQGWDVLRLIVGSGARLAALGVLLGLAVMLGLESIAASLFSDMPSPLQFQTIAPITVGLMVVALLASYLPARRAMRIDPATTLRLD